MAKIYVKTALLLVLTSGLLGFVLPWLTSSRDDGCVALAGVIAVIAFPVIYMLARSAVRDAKRLAAKKEDTSHA